MTFEHWLGRSLAIALLLSGGQSALARSPGFPLVTTPHVLASEHTMAAPDSLELVTWQLVSYQSSEGEIIEAFSESPSTWEFQDGHLFGTTGCNRFINNYTREGDRLTITQGGSTLMACTPEALAAQEDAILAGFAKVTRYSQIGDQLLLLDSEGNILFTLMPQPTTELTGTEWTLIFYNNGRGGLQTPILETAITATFDVETGLTGTAGCNRYRATYETAGNTITIGPASTTRRLCAQPEGIMEQESRFLALLQEVETYSIRGNQLDLRNADGTTLARFTTEL